MTEDERFSAEHNGFQDHKTGRRLTEWFEIIRVLNELAEENDQLEKEAEEYNEDAMSYQTLYEQQLEKFEELLSECKHQQEQKMKFYKENKELKQTIHRLKQNIDELLSVNVEEELLKENEQLKEAVYSWSKSYTRVYEENKRLRRCMNEIYTIARLEEVD